MFANTCAIREKAEAKIWNKIKSDYTHLKRINKHAVVGILGCMAERLRTNLLAVDEAGKSVVDIVAGPDAYRDLPNLIRVVEGRSESGEGRRDAVNV